MILTMVLASALVVYAVYACRLDVAKTKKIKKCEDDIESWRTVVETVQDNITALRDKNKELELNKDLLLRQRDELVVAHDKLTQDYEQNIEFQNRLNEKLSAYSTQVGRAIRKMEGKGFVSPDGVELEKMQGFARLVRIAEGKDLKL